MFSVVSVCGCLVYMLYAVGMAAGSGFPWVHQPLHSPTLVPHTWGSSAIKPCSISTLVFHQLIARSSAMLTELHALLQYSATTASRFPYQTDSPTDSPRRLIGPSVRQYLATALWSTATRRLPGLTSTTPSLINPSFTLSSVCGSLCCAFGSTAT